MENEILFIKNYPNAKDSYLESNILSMKELELLFYKVLKKKKKINSTEEFETIMKKTLNNKKVDECLGTSFTSQFPHEDISRNRYASNWGKENCPSLVCRMETYDENEIINAILKTPFKKKIIREIEKEFKIRLAKGRLKNFEKSISDATDYNGYDLLIYYLGTYKIFKVLNESKNRSFSKIFINCNDEPYDVDDVNTPISRTDVNVYM